MLFGIMIRLGRSWGRCLVICCIVWGTGSHCLYAKTLWQILDETQSQMEWHSWQQRGRITHDNHSIFFTIDQPYIVFSNGLVLKAVIYYTDGVISFDTNTSLIINHFLLTGNILSHKELKPSYRIATILIDPGHGGRDNGAIGRHGSLVVKEKDVTLAVGLLLAKELEKKYPNKKILLTRKDDSYPTLEERVNMANNLALGEGESAIFVSIHANAALNKRAKGFEFWYLPDGTERELYDNAEVGAHLRSVVNDFMNDEFIAGGKRLAQFSRQAFLDRFSNRTLDRGLREEAWFVVKGAHMTAILVELGFVTNEAEAKLLSSSSYQTELAEALAEGITNYVNYFEEKR